MSKIQNLLALRKWFCF